MEIPLDEVVHFDVITSHPVTGAAADADSTPTFEVFEEATDTDIGVGGNLTKRTSKTGNYRGSFTASAANGFELGKFYSIVVSATVGSVAGKTIAKQFRCIAAEDTAGYKKSTIKNGTGAGELAIASGIVNASLMAINGETPPLDNFYDDYNGNGYAGGTIKKQVDLRQIRGENVPATATTGVPKVAVTHVMTTALTESATGRLAASFSTMHNVATPVFTTASVNQGADSNTLLPGVSTRVLLALPAVGYDEVGGLRTSNQGTRTIYVKSDGNNANSGLSRSSPVQTFQQARTNSRPGDRIELLSAIESNTSISISKRVTISAADPSYTLTVTTTNDYALRFTSSARGSNLENIEVIDASSGTEPWATVAVDIWECHDVTLRNVKATSQHGLAGVRVSYSRGVKLDNVIASGNRFGFGIWNGSVYSCHGNYLGGLAGGYVDSEYIDDSSEDSNWFSEHERFTGQNATATIVPGALWEGLGVAGIFYETHAPAHRRNRIHFKNAQLYAFATHAGMTGEVSAFTSDNGANATTATFENCRVLIQNEGSGATYHFKASTPDSQFVVISTDHDPDLNSGDVQVLNNDIAATKAVVEDDDVGNGAIKDAIGAIESGATVSPYLVDPDHTWEFSSSSQTTSPKLLKENIGFDGLVAVDFDEIIPALTSLQSVTSATFANISGTEPTVGDRSVSADRKKAHIEIDASSATANTYTLTVTVLTADGQTFVRSGRIQVS